MDPTFKVSDLHSIFESIQRDINELIETKNKIPGDREYSESLLESIVSEIQKLEERKNLILNLEIKMPDEVLSRIRKIKTEPQEPKPSLEPLELPLDENPELPPKKNKPIRRY